MLFQDDTFAQLNKPEAEEQTKQKDDARIKQIQQQAESLLMTSKGDDIQQLRTYKSYVKDPEKVQFVAGQKTSSQDQRLPKNMAISLEKYAGQVQNTFYHAINFAIQTWNSMRAILWVVLHCRAIYGAQMFQIRRFLDIQRYFDANLKEKFNQKQPDQKQPDPELNFSVRMEDVVLLDSDMKTRKTKIIKIESDGKTDEMQIQLQQHQTEIQRLLNGLPYTSSKMRLLIDSSIIGVVHHMMMSFIRWQSSASKPENVVLTENRQNISLRNFCQLVTLRMISGGNDFGFIPYLEDLSALDRLMDNDAMLRMCNADEIANIIITFWVLPYYPHLFKLFTRLIRYAVKCDTVLYQVLNQLAGDLYMYLDCDEQQIPAGEKFFKSSTTN